MSCQCKPHGDYCEECKAVISKRGAESSSPKPASERRTGNSRLNGKPLDDDGAIQFERSQEPSPNASAEDCLRATERASQRVADSPEWKRKGSYLAQEPSAPKLCNKCGHDMGHASQEIHDMSFHPVAEQPSPVASTLDEEIELMRSLGVMLDVILEPATDPTTSRLDFLLALKKYIEKLSKERR